MTLGQLFGVWNNAIRKIAESDSRAWRRESRRMLKLVEAEWSKRSKKLRPQDYFDWPTTEAPGGDHSLFLQGTLQQGMLGFLGYHVGKEYGIPCGARQELLLRIFFMQLPPVVSPAYVAGWGAPESSMRLRKMAESIAAFARNLKRREKPEFEKAISDWESDLRFLHRQLYFGKFGFGWPDSTV